MQRLSFVLVIIFAFCPSYSKDNLQESIDSVHKYFSEKLLKEAVDQIKSNLPLNDAMQSNVCTGGRIPDHMKPNAYLKAFNSGPCQPLALLPGYSGSTITVKLDC